MIDYLQLTDKYSVATPTDWQNSCDCLILPTLQDIEELKQKCPNGFQLIRPYLDITPQPSK